MNPDNTTNESTSQTPASNSGGWKNRVSSLKNRKIVAGIILVTLLAAAIGYFIYKESQENTSKSNPADFSYDEELGDELTIEHLVKGESKNTSLSIMLPLNGMVYIDSPFDKSDGRLIPNSRQDVIIDEGNSITLGQRILESVDENQTRYYFQSLVAVYIVPEEQQSAFSSVEYFRRVIANYSFNTSSTPSTAGFGLQQPENFSNESVKKDAQIYRFAADLRDPNNTNPVKNMQGELIEIKGKNADYYVLVGATEQIWNSSQNTWKAIKDSIKVDQ